MTTILESLTTPGYYLAWNADGRRIFGTVVKANAMTFTSMAAANDYMRYNPNVADPAVWVAREAL